MGRVGLLSYQSPGDLGRVMVHLVRSSIDRPNTLHLDESEAILDLSEE
jgi:ABC-type molybdenum transport system ATPase subunit/photorepair protein PhrA